MSSRGWGIACRRSRLPPLLSQPRFWPALGRFPPPQGRWRQPHSHLRAATTHRCMRSMTCGGGGSAAIGAGTIGRSGMIPGRCCARRSGAVRSRTSFRPMSGRESGIRHTFIIGPGVTIPEGLARHVGEADAQSRCYGRYRRRILCPGAGDERRRDARLTVAWARESRAQGPSVLRSVWVRTYSLRSSSPLVALGPIGLQLPACLPDRLLLRMPPGPARLRTMCLLAVSPVLTTAPRSGRPPRHCWPAAASLR